MWSRCHRFVTRRFEDKLKFSQVQSWMCEVLLLDNLSGDKGDEFVQAEITLISDKQKSD